MSVILAEDEIEFTAVRAQGPGGQHVNKTSTAIQLRFDIKASSLSEAIKARLLACADQRITQDGVIVIKAQGSRSQAMNRADALARLNELVQACSRVAKPRRATKPTHGSQLRRLEAKSGRARIKSGRGRVQGHD